MSPSRPYKCLKDVFNDDTGKAYTMEVTLNLFEIDNWSECSNELEGFKDEVKRTIVYLPEGRAFILRVRYGEFDAMMLQLKKDYQMLDERSMNPSDKLHYKGFIKLSGVSTSTFMATTFHRKDYRLKGRSQKDFDDFAYHALFHNIYSMS